MSEEYFYDYFDSLDRDQFKAAIERESELLCEAGPGGGKTRTLVAKAVAECERRPVYIVTFTVSAADEIDQRIKSLLANSREYREVGKNWPGVRHVGTLHSWCLDWLRKNGCRQEVIDEKTVAEVAAEVNRRLRLKLSQKRMAELIAGGARESNGEHIFVESYKKEMAENGLLSYDGILQSARTYLEGSPPRWGPRRPLFLVDEIQDSSGDDLAIYDALKASGAELWLVGDLQQAIYSFRHRQPANVWAWWGKRPVAELKTNYRSSRAVIKALNLINANFVPRVEIVPAENAVDGEVRLLSSGSEPELLEQLWRRILLLSPTQRPLEQLVDFAVLCRTNRECHLVATMLKGRGMNVREKGGNGSERVPDVLWAALGFFRQPESDWMAKRYLRAIGVDPEATERSAVTAMRTMGQLIYPALFAVERTPFEWFSQSWMDLLQVPKTEQGWFYERLPEGWTDLSWDDITMRLFEAPGEQEKGTGVTVTTVHAAKGREWKHVLMPFADQLSYRPKNGMEEQRVFFVGASRAVQTLTFLFAKSRVDEWQGGETDVAMCEPLERILDGSKGGRKKRKPRS